MRGGLSVTGLLDDPDQENIRADLAHFFGANADSLLRVYEKIRSRPNTGRFVLLSWNWAVLFSSFGWFFYRKLWNAALICFAVELIAIFVPGTFIGYAWLIFPLIANTLYVRQGLSRIVLANMLGLAGEARSAYLRQAGRGWALGGMLATLLALACLAAGVIEPSAKLLSPGLISD